MRHKYIIITLALLLCVLLGIKAFLTTYPLQLDYSDYYNHSNSASEAKIQFAVSDRINNECDNPLFFCNPGVKLGMPKEDFDRLGIKNNSIIFDGMTIPADVIYKFKDDKLSSVGARFEMASFSAADNYLIDLLGERRLDIISGESIVHRIWYYKDSYFKFNYTKFSGDKYFYLKASNYNLRGSKSLNELALYGGSSDYEFEEESKSKSSSTSSKAYKYGDSDVYQGSSQQAADLAAIDAYFGF